MERSRQVLLKNIEELKSLTTASQQIFSILIELAELSLDLSKYDDAS